MALRGLRSAFKRSGDDPAATPGGMPAPGASVPPTGAPAPGMTHARGGYVPVRSFNVAATAAPATAAPATPPTVDPSASAPATPATGWGPRPAPGQAQRYGNPATGTVPHGWTPLGPATGPAAAPAPAMAPGPAAATPNAPVAGTAAPTTGAAATGRCPSCGRAITKGTRRCEGCGTRLLLEVPARKASMLVGAGALAGLVVGGVVFGIALPRSPAAATSDPAAAPSGAPFHVTGNMAAALRGTTALNGRLAAQADVLAAALAAQSFPVQDVVQVLRRMSTDTRAAAAMVKSLDSWPDAASQQAALASFYDELATELDAGLAASTTSAGSYKATTQTILASLTKVVDLDEQARVLAGAAGIQLPAVTIPAVLLKG